jgi:hypothetical protein
MDAIATAPEEWGGAQLRPPETFKGFWQADWVCSSVWLGYRAAPWDGYSRVGRCVAEGNW